MTMPDYFVLTEDERRFLATQARYRAEFCLDAKNVPAVEGEQWTEYDRWRDVADYFHANPLGVSTEDNQRRVRPE